MPKNEEVSGSAPKSSTLQFADRENWVILDFKLLNWKYMNFQMKFRENTHIFSIKKILRERLGKMNDLKICFNSYSEANEVHNDMLTLAQCGVTGAPLSNDIDEVTGVVPPDSVQLPTVTVYYDYKPSDFEDPVLLYFKG